MNVGTLADKKLRTMIKKIAYKTGATATGAGKPKAKRASSRLFTSTVEYTMIANLVSQQYQQQHDVLFDRLLAIPLDDRIPGLMERYGKKTMHRLLLMILKEFVATLGLPAYKRPTETRVSILACEIMLSSHEDFLALEDVILFLQRAKAGYFGPLKTMVTTAPLLLLLDQYRNERHQAYTKLKTEQEAGYKQMGPIARMAPEPTPINDLFHQGVVVDMTKKMSG
ncbi:MAG: hypothetical protein JWP27_162 [Flaviaesturariibacter sp.]|nr:hypothetical protein [Flaviaesturariibacter sp.]